jgi:hypothetical protein
MRRFPPLAAAALLLLSCVSGRGPCSLPAVAGRVVDRDTGAPIAGALVVEESRGGAVPSDAPPVSHARFATSDAEGRFAFDAAAAPGLGCASRGRRSYAFVHPDYGLVRGGEAASAHEIALGGSRNDSASQSALGALCEIAPSGAWEREIAKRACASRRR